MTFDQFYRQYPRKVARKDAEKAWAKLSQDERAKAVEALPSHIRYWDLKGTDKHYIPHPSTWLNGARFEDELDFVEAAPKAAVAWWGTDEGILAKGRSLNCLPRAGEGMPEYKQRVVEASRRAA